MVEEKEEEEEASSSKQQLRVEKRRLRGIKDRLIKRQQNIKHIIMDSTIIIKQVYKEKEEED
ncbi:hypothetical protein Pmar_PMAR006713 [Perkinsus marinus ATCC 50983]|uniref:Uncharacterized protein n=1 Tax=Perkinsus marinus (strain ATCC 50983 / TXsc) TaxID=423536 RepID=C5K6A1_PERM5|nr:hypothetical protein Pmar_PMAR006713 [Perkinsus marinus ATCC 50983]EER19821.1 hypothetical protein Pmar_PMAR006713 [Perkinsus marinus ATCC 50983]|eukprot:XP_002788025.1 hypothetical protein Pmar_PMAR006713 [Perkinsus marinus ATCC 50983]